MRKRIDTWIILLVQILMILWAVLVILSGLNNDYWLTIPSIFGFLISWYFFARLDRQWHIKYEGKDEGFFERHSKKKDPQIDSIQDYGEPL